MDSNSKPRFRIINESGNGIEEHPILPNGKPLISCVKGSRLGSKLKRVDRKGNAIDGDRKFQITYVDKVQKGEPLAQVHLVESYKKYNAEENPNSTSPCCSLF